MFVRYRQAGTVERQQLKWFGLVAGVAVVTFVISIPNNGPISDAAWALGLAMLPLLPIAIGIAILRYHLWDIDRIVSRTVGWALTTGLIGSLFAGLIVTLQAMLAPVTNESSLAFAASTLAAAALFQPARRRIQAAVDRRFNRSRYDAQATVDAFAEHLRDELDLVTLHGTLAASADEAVRPAGISVWLRNATIRPPEPTS